MAGVLGMLEPWCAAAGERPRRAFDARRLRQALASLYGRRAVLKSDAVRIETVALAEDGAVVPVQVRASVDQARSIALLAPENPVPLIALFEIDPVLEPFVATRVKLAASGKLIAIVDTGDALLKASTYIRVTKGGCA
jgi:sulfur-oxidizing protein SoxY